MTSMHAGYSLGAITGALIGGGFAWAGVGLLPSLAAAGLTGAVADGVAGHWLLPGRHAAYDAAAAPAVQAPATGRRRRPHGETEGTCGG